jgi:hypothetical protein
MLIVRFSPFSFFLIVLVSLKKTYIYVLLIKLLSFTEPSIAQLQFLVFHFLSFTIKYQFAKQEIMWKGASFSPNTRNSFFTSFPRKVGERNLWIQFSTVAHLKMEKNKTNKNHEK